MDGETMSVARDMQDDVIETIRWEQQRAIEHRIRVARIFALLQLAFLGVSLSAWAACLVGRLSGLLPVDELTQRYIMSLTSSLMLFAVGTAIIEQFRGDMVGGFLGRALAGVGLFVMAAHGYELLQKATAVQIWAQNQQAKPVANEAIYTTVMAITPAGTEIDWRNKDGRWDRSVPVVYRQRGPKSVGTGRSNTGIYQRSERPDSLPGGASGESTSADGSNAF